MKFALIIYLMDVLDSLKGLAVITIIFFCIAAVFLPMILDLEDIGLGGFWRKVSKPTLVSLAISFSIMIFVPSQKTAYTMMAAYGVQQAVDNPQVQEIAGDSLKAINKAMKKYLDESEDKPK